MADFTFNIAKSSFGGLGTFADLHDGDIRALLLKEVDTDANMIDVDTVAALLATSADEADAAGYSRSSALTLTTATDDTNNQATVTISADISFGTIAAGNTIRAAVIYLHVTNDSDSIPVAFYELTDTPTNGGEITVNWTASSDVILTFNDP